MCAVVCVCLKVGEAKCHCFYVYILKGLLFVPLQCFLFYRCQQKRSVKLLWIICGPLDESCDPDGGIRVVPPGRTQCAACSAPQCNTTPSTSTLRSITRFMKQCRFPVQLMLVMFSINSHHMIDLKTVDPIKLLSLLAMLSYQGVFPLCVPQNPTVHQGLCHCGMQIYINIFCQEKKRKEVREEEKKGGNSLSRCLTIAQSK